MAVQHVCIASCIGEHQQGQEGLLCPRRHWSFPWQPYPLSGCSIYDIISGRIFTSLAVVDVYNVSIVQQCRMLESELGTHTLASCLENPPEASITVKSAKATILKADFNALLSASINHPSAKYIATVATETSWCHLWDIALERGVQGTRRLQLLLKDLSRRPFDGFSCRSCGSNLNNDPSWFHHICSHHPEAVDNLSCEEIISTLKEGNIYVLSTVANLKLSSYHLLWDITHCQTCIHVLLIVFNPSPCIACTFTNAQSGRAIIIISMSTE